MVASSEIDTSAHFKVVVFRSPAITENNYLIYSGTHDNRHMLHLGNGSTVRARVGAGGSEGLVTQTFAPEVWTVAISTWNAATKAVGLSINGGRFAFDQNNDIAFDEAGVVVGFNCHDVPMSDVIWGSVDISETSKADLLALILDYTKCVLNLNVCPPVEGVTGR